MFSTGVSSIKKDKNPASAYNGIPAIFEITRGRFYQVDINSKSLKKDNKVYYKKFIPKNIKFLKPKKISSLSYLGDVKKIFVEDVYTQKKKSFVLKNELSYKDLDNFYGVSINFKIQLGNDFVTNLSKETIKVDNEYLKPNKTMRVTYPVYINNLKIDTLKKKLIFKKKVFDNFKIRYEIIRKKRVLSRNKLNYKK